MKDQKSGIYIEPKRKTWAHELRVAEILAAAGHYVELLVEGLLPTADLRLDGIEYELKSPERFNANTLQHTISNALKQSPNIIIDTARMKKVRDYQVQRFLISQVYKNTRIKRLLMITNKAKLLTL